MASTIGSKLSEMTGGLGDMAGSFTGIISGVKNATAGMNLFKVAMASTGVGLLVVGLAALVTYFTQTSDGSKLLSQGMAGLKAVVKVVIDTLADFGKVLVNVFSNPTESLKKFGNLIKGFIIDKFQQLIGGLKGIGTAFKLLFEGKFQQAATVAGQSLKDIVNATNPVAWAMDGLGVAVDAVKKKYGEASKEAKQAIELERQAQKLAQDKLKWNVEEGKILAQLKANKLKIAEEDKYSAAERIKFITQSEALAKRVGNTNIALAQREFAIKKALDSLGNNMLEDLQATNELERAISDKQGEAKELLEEIAGQRVTVKEQLKGEVAEHKTLVELQKEYNKAVKAGSIQKLETKTDAGIKLPALKPIDLSVKLKGIDPKEVESVFEPIDSATRSLLDRMNSAASELSSGIRDSLNSAIGGFASAIGGALAGDTSAFKGFLDGMLMMVIDFASNFGKLLISIGTAKVALESLAISGIGAIVAGGALVALTSMASAMLAKGAMPAFANGGISSGGLAMVGERGPELVSLPSGANVTRANKTEQLLSKSNNVQVTGRIETSGESLILLIEETKRRNGNRF